MDRVSMVAFLFPIAIVCVACAAIATEPDSLSSQTRENSPHVKMASLPQDNIDHLEKVVRESIAAVRLQEEGDLEGARQMREQAAKSLHALAKMSPLHFAAGANQCARAYSAAGHFDSALELLTIAWQRIERINDEQATILRHRLTYTAGGINLTQEKFLDAKQHFAVSAEIAREYFGIDSEDYGETLALLGLAELKLDEYEEAIPHLNDAEEILSPKLGKKSKSVISIRVNRATIMRLQGDLASAEKILTDTLEQLRGNSENIDSLLRCQINLAKVCIEKEAYVEAEQLLKEVCAVCHTHRKQEEWIVSQGTLAKVYRLDGQLSKAKIALDEALNVAIQKDPNALNTAGLLHERALLAIAEGDLDAAIEPLNQAIRLAHSKLPPTHRLIKEYEQTKDVIRKTAS